MGRMNAYKISLGRPEGKRPPRRHGRRWEDNIKMDLRAIWWGGMDWINLAHDGDQLRALVNTVMKLWALSNVGIFLISCATGGFSGRAQLHGVSLVSDANNTAAQRIPI
jgi:hypothetical protein